MENNNEAPGLKLRPLDWAQTRATLKPLYDAKEHWMMVIHPQDAQLMLEVERKYYGAERSQDFILLLIHHGDQPYYAVAARKKRMLAYQFRSLLRQVASVRLNERELLGSDVVVVAPEDAMPGARSLIVELFSDTLAMEG